MHPEDEKVDVSENLTEEMAPTIKVEDMVTVKIEYDESMTICCICSESVMLVEALPLWVDSRTPTHFGRILYKLLSSVKLDFLTLQYCCGPCSKDVLACFQLMVQVIVGTILTNRGLGRLSLSEVLDQGCHICGTVLPTMEEFTDHFIRHVAQGTEHSGSNTPPNSTQLCPVTKKKRRKRKAVPVSEDGEVTKQDNRKKKCGQETGDRDKNKIRCVAADLTSLVKVEHSYNKPKKIKKKIRIFLVGNFKKKRSAYNQKERIFCHLCGGFRLRCKFKRHMEYHRRHPNAKPVKERVIPQTQRKNPNRRKWGERRANPPPEEKPMPLTCEHCGVYFDRRCFLINHLVVCHSESLREVSKRYSRNWKMEPWTCGVCAEKIDSIKCFKKHCEEEHNGEGYVQFKCEACPSKVFATNHLLRMHVRAVHDRPNCSAECDICGVSFSGHVTLRRHKKLKHSVTDFVKQPQTFKCHYCDEIFNTGRKVYRHIISEHDPNYRGMASEDAMEQVEEEGKANSIRYCNVCRRKTFLYTHKVSTKNREKAVQWLKNTGLDVDYYMEMKSVTICNKHFDKDQFQFLMQRGNPVLKPDAVPTLFPSNPDLPPPSKLKWRQVPRTRTEPPRKRKLIYSGKTMCCLCSKTFQVSEALSLRSDGLQHTHFGKILFSVLKLSDCDVRLLHCCVPCSKDVLTCFQLMVQINVGAILTSRGCGRLPLAKVLGQGCHICRTVLPTVEEFTDHFILHVVQGEAPQSKKGATIQDECEFVKDVAGNTVSELPAKESPLLSMREVEVTNEETAVDIEEPPTKKTRMGYMRRKTYACSLCLIKAKSREKLIDHFKEHHKWRLARIQCKPASVAQRESERDHSYHVEARAVQDPESDEGGGVSDNAEDVLEVPEQPQYPCRVVSVISSNLPIAQPELRAAQPESKLLSRDPEVEVVVGQPVSDKALKEWNQGPWIEISTVPPRLANTRDAVTRHMKTVVQVIPCESAGERHSDLQVPQPESELPAEQPDSELPAEQPDSELPAEQPDSELPAEQPDSELPAEQPDSELPAEQPDSELPAEHPDSELPAEQPDSELPAEQPDSELPAEQPDSELPAEQPDSELPAEQPQFEIPAEQPEAELPLGEPVTGDVLEELYPTHPQKTQCVKKIIVIQKPVGSRVQLPIQPEIEVQGSQISKEAADVGGTPYHIQYPSYLQNIQRLGNTIQHPSIPMQRVIVTRKRFRLKPVIMESSQEQEVSKVASQIHLTDHEKVTQAVFGMVPPLKPETSEGETTNLLGYTVEGPIENRIKGRRRKTLDPLSRRPRMPYILKKDGDDARLVEDQHAYFKNKRIREERLAWRKQFEKKVLCHLCGQLRVESGMKDHLKAHENNPEYFLRPRQSSGEISSQTSGAEPVNHTCRHCGAEFDRRFFLVNHLVFKHDENLHEVGGSRGRKGPTLPWKCGLCAEEIFGIKSLRKHCKEKHDGAGTIQFPCEACPGKNYSNPHRLRDHMKRYHTPFEMTYLCDLCGISCSSKSNLLRHTTLKHPPGSGTENSPPKIRTFVCQFCGKTFYAGRSWHKHIRQEHDPNFVREVKTPPKKAKATEKQKEYMRRYMKERTKRLREEREKRAAQGLGDLQGPQKPRKPRKRKPRERKSNEPQTGGQLQELQNSQDAIKDATPQKTQCVEEMKQPKIVVIRKRVGSGKHLPLQPQIGVQSSQVTEEAADVGGTPYHILYPTHQQKTQCVEKIVVIQKPVGSRVQLPIQPEIEVQGSQISEEAADVGATPYHIQYPSYPQNIQRLGNTIQQTSIPIQRVIVSRMPLPLQPQIVESSQEQEVSEVAEDISNLTDYEKVTQAVFYLQNAHDI